VSHEPDPHADGTPGAEAHATTAMLGLIDGFRVSRLVWIAAQLGIADLLRDGASSSAELAAATRTDAPSLARVLRALAALGILAQDEQDRFALTPLGMTLRSDVQGSLRPWALFALGEENHRAWGALEHSLTTGETAFEHVFGLGVWEYRARHPESGRLFDAAMATLVARAGAALAASYPFSGVQRVVDVGGGDGTLLIALLRAHPRLAGTLVELPAVIASARERIADAGLTERCNVIASDVLASVPEGGDCYLLARVVHDWDDERAVAILRNCARVLPERGVVLVFERVLPARAEPSTAARAATLTDVTLLVSTGGRERTETEYQALFAAAGLKASRIISTTSGLSVIECARSGPG
jgi:hypothetical protein